MMLHETLVELQRRGHQIRLIVRKAGARAFEGIQIEQYLRGELRKALLESDLLLTQLQEAAPIIKEAQSVGLPTAYIQHITRDGYVEKLPKNVLLVVNSQTMFARAQGHPHRTILYPAIDPSRYQVQSPGSRITLINLNTNKGGQFFWDLARFAPQYQFLGVSGAYGQQIVPHSKPSNVLHMSHTPTIRDAYAMTKILLLPSEDESWGRVAIEAAVSGIPTIARNTPGIAEALGPSGILLPRREPNLWIEAIETLQDEKNYECYSRAARDRAAQFIPERVVDPFEAALIDHASRHRMFA